MLEKTIIRKATSADVNRLVTHLVRAFDKDPVMHWVVRQDSKRAYGFDTLFRASLNKLGLPHGEVLTTEDCLGSALWYPPEKTQIRLPQQLLMLPAMICACRLPGLKRLKNVLNRIEKAHPTKNTTTCNSSV